MASSAYDAASGATNVPAPIIVDCHHGSWNSATLMCDCDEGWSTDWSNQSVLDKNFIYCNSRASTPSPRISQGNTASPSKSQRNLIIMIVGGLVLAAAIVVLLVVWLCRRHRRKKEKAMRDLTEMQLRQGVSPMWWQTPDNAMQRDAFMAQIEAHRRSQSFMHQKVSLYGAAASPAWRASHTSRRFQPRSNQDIAPFANGVYRYDTGNDEVGNTLAESYIPARATEPLADENFYYPDQEVPPSVTELYSEYAANSSPYYAAPMNDLHDGVQIPPQGYQAWRHPRG